MFKLKPIVLGICSASLAAGCAWNGPSDLAKLRVQPMTSVRDAVSKPDDMYQLGRYYQGQMRYELAASAYRKALAIDPNFAEAHNGLGVVYSMQGNQQQAVEEFNAAIALAPKGAHLYNNLGYAYLLQGQNDKAAAALEKAVGLEPDNQRAMTHLQTAYLNLGNNPDKAKQLADLAAEAGAKQAEAVPVRSDSAPEAAPSHPRRTLYVIEISPEAGKPSAKSTPSSQTSPSGAASTVQVVQVNPSAAASARPIQVVQAPSSDSAGAVQVVQVNQPAAAPAKPIQVVQSPSDSGAVMEAVQTSRPAAASPAKSAPPAKAAPSASSGTMHVAMVNPPAASPARPAPEAKSPPAGPAGTRIAKAAPPVTASPAKPAPRVQASPSASPADAHLVKVEANGFELRARPRETTRSVLSRKGFGLEISNGNGVSRMAHQVGGFLQWHNVATNRLTNQKPFSQTVSQIQYRSGYRAQAESVSAALPKPAALVETSNLRWDVNVRLVLGRDLIADRRVFAGQPGVKPARLADASGK
jgi:hypothetical protein